MGPGGRRHGMAGGEGLAGTFLCLGDCDTGVVVSEGDFSDPLDAIPCCVTAETTAVPNRGGIAFLFTGICGGLAPVFSCCRGEERSGGELPFSSGLPCCVVGCFGLSALIEVTEERFQLGGDWLCDFLNEEGLDDFFSWSFFDW